jgi:hypothetical protein
MPRLPVDGKKVVEHRITLGTKERELLDSALGAYQFNRVATPIVAGLSDISFLIAVGSILSFFYPNIIIPSTIESIGDVTRAIRDGITGTPGFEDDPIARALLKGIEEGTIFGRLFL